MSIFRTESLKDLTVLITGASGVSELNESHKKTLIGGSYDDQTFYHHLTLNKTMMIF
jgi:hypothetical protein